jgi:hypothetical protein
VLVVEQPGAALLAPQAANAQASASQTVAGQSSLTAVVARPQLVQDMRALWVATLERSQDASEHRRLRILLPDMQPETLKENTLTISTHPSLLHATRGVADELANLLRRLAGTEIRVIIAEPVAVEAAEVANPQDDAVRIAEHPLIRHAVELFGGKVVGRQVRKKQSES